jgi:very-short-patch-repair endonuclease
LRNNQLDGYKFRRQHLIKVCSRFYCHQLKLVIEIDGEPPSNRAAEKLDRNELNIEDQD